MKSLLRKLKPFCSILVLGFMAWGLWSLRATLYDALASAHWAYLCLAGLVAGVYLFLNASVWGLICRMVGVEPNRWKAAALWIECEAMRWLPGGIWGYASRVVEAKRIGLGKVNGGLSLGLELAITVLSWATLGCIGLLVSPSLQEVLVTYLQRISALNTVIIGGGVALGCVGVIVLIGVRKKLLSTTAEIRQSLFAQKHIAFRALGEYLCLNVFYSLGFLLCLKGVGVSPLPSLIEAAGSYGLAWIVGFVAFGAPGGMGVREGFLYLVFAPLGIGAEVVTTAILWRAIQILVELVMLLFIKMRTQFS